MPLIISTLIGALIEVAGSIVGRVLISLGISFVSYTGFSALFDWIKGDVIAQMQGLNPTIVGMLATFKVDTCITIMFSAINARLTIAGLNSGALKRMVQK